VYSGKFIEVHLDDTGCCSDIGPSTETFKEGWMVLPALIFPRPPTMAQNCVLCPAGKFYGAYAATNISQCTDIVAPMLERRYLQVPVSHVRSSNSVLAPLDSKPFKTYMETQGVFISILEIRQVAQSEPSLQHIFDLEAWLDIDNATFVLDNSAELSAKICKIFDAQRNDMKTTDTRARQIRVGGDAITVFSMQGMYADLPLSSTATVPETTNTTDAPGTTPVLQADDAAKTTILPTTTPIPETKAAVENYETTISFKLNSDMSQITDVVTSAIRINLSVELNVDIIHISALSFEQTITSARRLLEVRASLTVTSSSLAASQNVNAKLSHEVFNAVLASSSNNGLVASDFEVTTTRVGESRHESTMSDTMFVLIIGCGSVALVFISIVICVIVCKKSATTPMQYNAVKLNPVEPEYF